MESAMFHIWKMSTTAIPTCEPTQFAAGDSLSWTKNLSDQQSKDGWTTLYCFRGYGLSFLDVPSDETANNHLTTITPEMSTGLLPGTYKVAGYALNVGQRIQFYSCEIVVTENFQTADQSFDDRTQNRRTLDNINAVIEGRANSTMLNSEVEGTRLGRIPHKDLLDLQALYQVKVRNEEIGLLQKQGKPGGRSIYRSFGRVGWYEGDYRGGSRWT